MTGRRPRSGRALARVAATTLRAYTGAGGPVLAVALFLSGAGVWWALGSLVPWFVAVRLMNPLRGR